MRTYRILFKLIEKVLEIDLLEFTLVRLVRISLRLQVHMSSR